VTVDRVKWFRERANRDRHREEVEILEADFERTALSHSRMAEVWDQLAESCIEKLGASAYAKKKVGMYTGLAIECSKKSADAKRIADKADSDAVTKL
jgi:hypothetical protein